MRYSLDELKKMAKNLGIETEAATCRQDYINAIAAYHVDQQGGAVWALAKRLKYPCPMQAVRYESLPEDDRRAVIDSDQWQAEEMVGGCRAMLILDTAGQIRIYAAERGPDMLPLDLTEIMVPDEIFTGLEDKSLVLDIVIYADGDLEAELRGRGYAVRSHGQAVSAFLKMRPAQIERLRLDNPLMICALDVLHWAGEDVMGQPYAKRREFLAQVADIFSTYGWPVSVPVVPPPAEKEKFIRRQLDIFGRVMLKNLAAKYQAQEYPPPGGWVDLRRGAVRRVDDLFRVVFPGYITGYSLGRPGMSYAMLVESLEISVQAGRGRKKKSEVAGVVTNLPLDLRKNLTFFNPATRRMELKEEYIFAVVEVAGIQNNGSGGWSGLKFVRMRPDLAAAQCVKGA